MARVPPGIPPSYQKGTGPAGGRGPNMVMMAQSRYTSWAAGASYRCTLRAPGPQDSNSRDFEYL